MAAPVRCGSVDAKVEHAPANAERPGVAAGPLFFF
jgi:hypothetical protein